MNTILLLIPDVDFPTISTHDILLAIVAGLCSLFLGITFGQSAFDKITDFKGNREYFNSQFGKSPLKNFIRILLPLITLMEMASAILCLSGIAMIFFSFNLVPMVLGLLVSAMTLLCLLFGQRIAKDYIGASSLSGYFLVAVAGLIAFALAM